MEHDLSRLKTEIDLRAVVMSFGFREDASDRWAGHHTFKQNGKHRIYLSQKPSGWFFWHPASGIKGSAIDFLCWQKGIPAKAAIDELRDWNGTSAIFEIAKAQVTRPDRGKVQDAIARMKRVKRSAFLEDERCIPAIVLSSWRFAGKILEDRRGNIVFPHVDDMGVCGGEVRNRKFKGFVKGGRRGLWLSKAAANDNRLFVCESAIDCISAAALQDDGKTRYASFGGTPTNAQVDLLQTEIHRMRPSSSVVAATDCDDAGQRAAEFVRAACEVALQDGSYVRELPWIGKDFNDTLRADCTPRITRLRTLGPR